MKKFMKNALLICSFLCMLLQGLSLQAATAGPGGNNKAESVIIDLDIVAQMSWTPMAGNTPYQVVVTDLSTGQVYLQTSTFQTSVMLGQLTPGHTYLCSVSRGAIVEAIIYDIDVID